MAVYKGKKVKLNTPSYIRKGQPSYGRKKSQVYVKNAKGRVVRVTFGDPKMRIKRTSKARRASFRSRHKCATVKDRTTARYWSCKAW